ncbi:Alpha/Beta hydrolase protein [Xylariomycetidae sp. FL2044]|nr:Alpha/Beta hydrolase protein [Xylariomycetidae sp. FL2044]
MNAALSLTLQVVLVITGVPAILYIGVLTLLITAPSLQAYVVYLHKVTLTWSKDLNIPEQFGFLRNQVAAFFIDTEDGVRLHAWLIVPSGVYERNQEEIFDQNLVGPIQDTTETVNSRRLRDDPEARLVLYMHGTSGTLGSTVRPASYRNIYSAAPNHVYVSTFDYRGYGLSSGVPSEPGLLLDALAVVKWATTTARIPHGRIVIYGQSLGSAVTMSLANHLAKQDPSHPLAGVIITASFTDLPALTATYRIGGLIPVLAPIAKIPPLFRFFTSRLRDTWRVKDHIAEFVQHSNDYHLTLIHAEDDRDIPVSHTLRLFWHAVSATRDTPRSFESLQNQIARCKVDLGPGGWYIDYTTEKSPTTQKGTIRLHILRYGEHDWQMTYPITSSAVLRVLKCRDPDFSP